MVNVIQIGLKEVWKHY